MTNSYFWTSPATNRTCEVPKTLTFPLLFSHFPPRHDSAARNPLQMPRIPSQALFPPGEGHFRASLRLTVL
ncbi:hypothetical protein L596_017575 [Steinernema carpocapsae]|uniref:Uncharacterized protein n=1 Tax=Steinernema carpocapsae TaxID=34508 RepID=A0A4U5N2E9_STECR|nr:hypothetical protein L596_017575 [Steinernema carpocapsae]